MAKIESAAKLKAILKNDPQLHYAPGRNRKANYIVNRFTGERIQFGQFKWLTDEHVEEMRRELTVADLEEVYRATLADYRAMAKTVQERVAKHDWEVQGLVVELQVLKGRCKRMEDYLANEMEVSA